jgi:hypothetical protein
MPLSLTDKDLPPLYHSADQSSQEAQRWFLHATRARLLGLLAAAVFGLFVWRTAQSPVDWAGVLAALCFTLAVLVEVYLLRSKPERTWYEGRAAAESVKTLSWRYVMRAEPFNAEQSPADADSLFLQQLKSVLGVLKDVDLAPDAAVGKQITDAMRAVRAAPLSDRKVAYEEYRVADQQSWYSRKAKWNRDRANHWTFAMLGIEAAGIGGGILKAVGTIQGDVLGLAGAVVAAMTAWLQTKQHRSLAAAYTVTALELASVRSQIGHQESEGDWATFVSDAEEAFSREHTLWKASRGVGSI